MNILSIDIKEHGVFQSLSVKKILSLPALWRERSIMRHKLGQLPAYRLEDMGINADAAFAESQKPFWVE